ncbi:MAG: AraC family transcriptional regulator [bacterium]|nr:AraC family transcriptional regulator [bacterium]
MYYQTTFQGNQLPEKSNISCFSYDTKANDSFPLHCHSYYELSYVIHGTRYETFNGIPYKITDGSLFFIPPFIVHSNQNTTDVTDLVLQFTQPFLQSNGPGVSSILTLPTKAGMLPYSVIEKDSKVENLLLSLASLCKEQKDPVNIQKYSLNEELSLEWKQRSLLLSLLSQLVDEKQLTFQTEETDFSQLQQLDIVMNYILSHPDEKLDMKTAAHMSGISYYHFSRLFQSVTGFSYTQYCNILRIRHAESLLLNTSMSIAWISNAIGIESTSYFTRLFKQITGMAPLSYRNQYKH